MAVLSFNVPGKPVASNAFVFVHTMAASQQLEDELEFLANLILDLQVVIFFRSEMLFFAQRKVNSLAIDGECRQIHLPHADVCANG